MADRFGWFPRWSLEQINAPTLERPELRSRAGAWERSKMTGPSIRDITMHKVRIVGEVVAKRKQS